MSDAVSRAAVLDILSDEGWLGDSLRRIHALPAVQPDIKPDLLEAACVAAHNAYEAAAHEAGWTTNIQSRKPWAEVPEANKAAMRAGIGAALALIDKPSHVNETPKSEHDAANMLTPATKGERDD